MARGRRDRGRSGLLPQAPAPPAEIRARARRHGVEPGLRDGWRRGRGRGLPEEGRGRGRRRRGRRDAGRLWWHHAPIVGGFDVNMHEAARCEGCPTLGCWIGSVADGRCGGWRKRDLTLVAAGVVFVARSWRTSRARLACVGILRTAVLKQAGRFGAFSRVMEGWDIYSRYILLCPLVC